MLDATKYTEKNFLQILRGNPNYQTAVAELSEWKDVVNVIDSLEVQYTAEQLEYVRKQDWD